MKRKWGQHFLVRERYVRRMIEQAEVSAEDQILEIGPGGGVLTRALLETGAQVTAVEIDPVLQARLCSELKGEERFRLQSGDVLELPVSELLPTARPAKIVANLPYNVATAIFFRLFPYRQHWDSWTLMVQLEVAERICAQVGHGKAYGSLSIAGDLGFERSLAFEIPPTAFSPPPKVESAVVHLHPRSSDWPNEQEGKFLEFVRKLFQQRRKTLISNLGQQFPEWLSAEEAELRARYGKQRPENLGLSDWQELFGRFVRYGDRTGSESPPERACGSAH